MNLQLVSLSQFFSFAENYQWSLLFSHKISIHLTNTKKMGGARLRKKYYIAMGIGQNVGQKMPRVTAQYTCILYQICLANLVDNKVYMHT